MQAYNDWYGIEGRVHVALKRPVDGAGDGRRPGVLPVDPAGELYPKLFEYLASDTWDDGSTRKPATLLLFYEDGVAKVCLNDRACQRAMWESSGDMMTALQRVEDALASGTGSWRHSEPWSGGKKGK